MDNCAERVSQNSGSGVIVSAVQSTTSTSVVDNIVKAGLMKKGKRGKKVYLVLREDSYASPACIQYYESEKRFRKNKPADYVLKLKEVFNVNRIKHPRMKFALAVFGYKDTLYLGCDVEDDLESWFHTILNVYTGTKSGSLEEDSRPKFDYVWDVNAEIKQIEELRDLSGPCRLCLTRRSLYVYKKPFPDIYREFPLVSVSDYGHNDNYFMIKLGRSADTGPGSIFFRAEDPDGSKNIHDVLLTITGENHEERLRSSSDSSSRRTSTLSPSSRTGGSTRSMTDRYSTALVTNSLLPRRTGIIESEKKLKEIRSMFARDTNSAMVLAGGCSRSSISSLSSSGSLSHPGSHRFSRVGSDCINPLPVVKEGGGSGSGAEYLPMEKHVITKDTTSSVEPGYAEMKAANGPTPTPSYHLEEVRSYISDDSFTSAADPLGARAYSLGAKMLPRSSGADKVGRDDSTSNTTGAACLDVGIYQTMEDRKRALSFDSRKHYNRINTASEKIHDLRLDIDSRCDSVSSTSRRMTDSSRRSNFSEDLVEIDFNHTHSSSTGRSPSNSFSSTDSLTRTRANSGLIFNRFNRRKSNDEILSPASRFVQQQLLHEYHQQPPPLSLKADATQDYVPMDSHAPSVTKPTSAYTVTVTAEIEPLPKNSANDQAKTLANMFIAQSTGNSDYQSVMKNAGGDYVVMETKGHKLTEHQDPFTNCVDEYAPMDFNNQSTKLSSSPKSYLSSLNRSILPIHNTNVVPIEEEIELFDQTTINTDRVAMSKNYKSSDIATVEPTEQILKNDDLHYAALNMRLLANANAFKSSPGHTPKQSSATFNNNNDNKEEIVDKIVYAKIQPGNLVGSATKR